MIDLAFPLLRLCLFIISALSVHDHPYREDGAGAGNASVEGSGLGVSDGIRVVFSEEVFPGKGIGDSGGTGNELVDDEVVSAGDDVAEGKDSGAGIGESSGAGGIDDVGFSETTEGWIAGISCGASP